MPGRRYGGYMVGNKYVRASRRHQATDTDAWIQSLGTISTILLGIFQLAVYAGAFILLLMLLQAFGWPSKH